MTILQYPKDLQPGQVDYITFKSQEYRANKAQTGGPNAGPPSSGADIILYMPTTTPAVTQQADWQSAKFEGPAGEVVRNLSTEAAQQIMEADISTFEKGKETGKNIIDGVRRQFEENIGSVGAVGQQIGVGLVAGFAGTSANGLLAMSRGEIYNPNVELLYQGPKLRSFNLQFQFVPKDPAEAKAVNDIILEFKKWSAPSIKDKNMMTVPHIWQITYNSSNGQNKNMNAFKKAACTNVAVQNNQGMNMHMSFEDGMPILTTMSLTFQEVDIITREDHLDGTTNVGY